VAQPAKSPFANNISGAGLVEPSTQNIAVSAALSGVVTRVHVQAGQQVAAQAPLFTLDERPLRAERDSRQAAVQVAEARVAEAEAGWHDARAQHEKVQGIADPRAVSREEATRRETAARAAESRLKSTRAALNQAGAQLRQTEVDLERLTVRAPVAGEILQLNVRPGEYLASGAQPAPVVMGDTRVLHVRVDIDESEAWRFKPGTKAVASLRGNADIRVPVNYVRTEPYVLPKKSLTGSSLERVDTRVLQILFAFERGELPIFVGQQMDVFVEVPAQKGKS
jgi:multidrug resistance efflux pump